MESQEREERERERGGGLVGGECCISDYLMEL